MQDTPMNKNSFAHTPVLCIAQKACNLCMGEIDKPCKKCKQKEFIFCGENRLKNMCDCLFSSDNKNSVAIAHNMKGFDDQFVLQYMHSNAERLRIDGYRRWRQCFFLIFLSQAFGSTIQILSSKIKFFQAISKNHYKSAFYLFLYV